MPLKRYALVTGTLGRYEAERANHKSPHFKFDIFAGTHKWQAAVNVKSRRWPSQVAVWRQEGFLHPIVEQIARLDPGLYPVRYYPKRQKPNRTLALDYVRDGLFDHSRMVPVEAHLPGRNNDIMDVLAQDVIETRKANGRVFVWGEPYNNRSHRGIHNIHQNQGNSRRYHGQNGVDQDGALLFWNGATTIAYFIAFQSQTYRTIGGTGQSLDPDETLFALMCQMGRFEGLGLGR